MSSYLDMCMMRAEAEAGEVEEEEDGYQDDFYQRRQAGDDFYQDDDIESQLSSSKESNHAAEAQLFPPGALMARANEMNTYQVDDEESNVRMMMARMNHTSSVEEYSRPTSCSLDNFHFYNDNDEESQISQPPGSIEIEMQIDALANDTKVIESIIDSITDPATKAVLESLIEHPGSTYQHDDYINKPDPAQHSWSPIDVLYDGLLYAGFDMHRLKKNNFQRKAKWFKTFYGVDHTTVSPYLLDLKKKFPGIKYRDYLMTMNWLTLYEVYPVLSARWKRSEEYIGSKIIECSIKMAELAQEKISLPLQHKVELGRTIDCTTFQIFEMRQDPHTKWFDWKTHSAGLVRAQVMLFTCHFHLLKNRT